MALLPSPDKGKTVVCNTETCVVGDFKPMATGTAHQRVAKAAGITPVVAGSIKLQRRVMRAG